MKPLAVINVDKTKVKKITIIITCIVILILTFIFFAFYDSKYSIFEESKANNIADYIILTLYSLVLLFFIITGLYISIKKNRFNAKDFLKEIVMTTFCFALFHFIFLRASISGIILYVNENVGEQKEININGKITSKLYIKGKGARREITIFTESDTKYEFDLDYTEIEKYQETIDFNQNLKIGYLGLVYL